MDRTKRSPLEEWLRGQQRSKAWLRRQSSLSSATISKACAGLPIRPSSARLLAMLTGLPVAGFVVLAQARDLRREDVA